MSDLPVALQTSLLQKLGAGVGLTTDYSGIGQAEHALQRLQAWAAESFAPGTSPPSYPGRAADIVSHCQEVRIVSKNLPNKNRD